MNKIQLPQNANPCERFAAAELTDFIKACVSSFEKPYVFHIGRTARWEEIGLATVLPKLKTDGFAIKSAENEVFIFGRRDRGTLYGVYEFIERFLKVNFVARDYTYIPPPHRVVLGNIDLIDNPDFDLRSYRCYQMLDPLFAVRKRMVVTFGKNIPEYGGGLTRDFYDLGHNALRLVPESQYLKDHADFYVMKGGKPVDICWSNGVSDGGNAESGQNVCAAIIKSVIDICKANPEIRYFMIAQEDSVDDKCQCEKCRSRAEKYGAYSANFVIMLNAVAKEVNRWAESVGREICLVTFAYNYTERPPVKKVNGHLESTGLKCDEHVYIKLALSCADYAHSFVDPKQNGSEYHELSYKEVFEGWKMVADHFMIYDYSTNFFEYLWYFPNRKVLEENYRFYKKIGAVYVESQAEHDHPSGFQSDLKCYIASALLWNTEKNADALTEEFCRAYYREAAESVLEVIRMFDLACAEADARFGDYGMHLFLYNWGNELSPKFYSGDTLKSMCAILRREIDRAKDGVLKKRLQKVIITPQRMLVKHASAYLNGKEKRYYTEQLKKNCFDCGIYELSEGETSVVLEKTGETYGGKVSELD